MDIMLHNLVLRVHITPAEELAPVPMVNGRGDALFPVIRMQLLTSSAGLPIQINIEDDTVGEV